MSDLHILIQHPEHLYHHLKTKNGYYDIEQCDSYGNTPLLKACYLGETKSVKYLLEFKANIAAINSCGQSTLNLAIWSGRTDLVELLLSKRSYREFAKSSMIPPTCVAQLKNWDEMVNYLHQKYGAGKFEQTVHGLNYTHIKMLKNAFNQRE